MPKEWICSEISELNEIAKELLSTYSEERIFAFVGKMGAGKTTFIKALCASLRVEEEVSSPTFSLVNEYERGKEATIFHFDFYRINDESEAFDIGFEEYLDSGNYCFIEWPNEVDSLLPTRFVLVKINEEDGKRIIESELIVE